MSYEGRNAQSREGRRGDGEDGAVIFSTFCWFLLLCVFCCWFLLMVSADVFNMFVDLC
jgi:hypothetical protein